MSFKPSLRDVLPDRLQQPARTLLVARGASSLAGTPWFVRALTGFGAWMASLFLMCFLALAVVVGKEVGAIVLGLVIITGAVMLRHQSEGVFLTQLLLAMGLAGQGLVIGGVAFLAKGSSVPVFTTLVLQTAVLFVYPDTVQRFLSALFASTALLIFIHLVMPGVLVDVVVVGLTLGIHLLFLHQGRLQATRLGELVTPAAFGLVLTLLTKLVMRTLGHHSLFDALSETHTALPPGVLTLGITAVTLYSVWQVLRELGAETRGGAGPLILGALALTAGLTLDTPGVITTLGLLVLGFHRRSALLMGVAVVFILSFGAYYYYDLHVTLLAKSLALLGSGLVFLGARLFILRRMPAPAEVA